MIRVPEGRSYDHVPHAHYFAVCLVENPETYQCDQCKRVFYTEGMRDDHRNCQKLVCQADAMKEVKFRYGKTNDPCTMSFSNEMDLRNHHSNIHFACVKEYPCGLKFSSRNHLTSHVRRKHRVTEEQEKINSKFEEIFVCEVCGFFLLLDDFYSHRTKSATTCDKKSQFKYIAEGGYLQNCLDPSIRVFEENGEIL